MIGFGAFGGSPFPTRRVVGNPESGQVQSDDEFNMAWQQRLDAVPRTIVSGSSSGPVQLVQGASGFNADAARPWLDSANASLRDAWMSSIPATAQNDMGGFSAVWDTANKFGVMPMMNADGTMSLMSNPYTSMGGEFAASQGASHTVDPGPTYTYTTNPEWARLNMDFEQATKERGENQIRQQQAYNTMLMGDGQIGGVMGANYGDPNFGQITGQPANASTMGMTGFGGGLGMPGSDLTGIQDTTQTGQYMGGAGRYNPSPFSPSAFQNRNPWAGL